MKMFLNSAKALFVAIAVTSVATAVPIVGTLDISSQVTLNTALLSTATAALATTGTVVASDGSYTGTNGSVATFAAFGWNPSTAPVANLWSYVSGLNTYSFNLTTLALNVQNSTFLNVTGSGVLNITGFDPTPGAWSYTITSSNGQPNSDGKFTFISTNSANIPDGGTTALLLGLSLLGMGCFGRRRLLS